MNKKQKNVKQESEQDNQKQRLATKALDIIEKGVKDIVVFGVHEGGLMELGTTYESFENIHAILNRALFELNMTHAKQIMESNKREEATN